MAGAPRMAKAIIQMISSNRRHLDQQHQPDGRQRQGTELFLLFQHRQQRCYPYIAKFNRHTLTFRENAKFFNDKLTVDGLVTPHQAKIDQSPFFRLVQ